MQAQVELNFFMCMQNYTHFVYTQTSKCLWHTFVQLKNMVSALFQSRPRERGGTRKSTINSCTFGWSVIEDMYKRELQRIRSGHCSRVPKLKESYICCDSWTRLNVQPSKIMQVLTIILYVYSVPYFTRLFYCSKTKF